MGAVTLRKERQSITIDTPEIVAELCSEMRFLDRELLRVVLLNARQHLIKVVTVSQGTVNESLAHPREIFKPVISHSAYSFVMVHNHPSGDATPSEADIRLTRRINEASRILELKFMDHVIIGTPAPGQDSLFQLQRRGRHRMTPKALFSELLCDSHSERWNEFELPKFSLVNWPRYTERKKSYVQGPVSRFVPLSRAKMAIAWPWPSWKSAFSHLTMAPAFTPGASLPFCVNPFFSASARKSAGLLPVFA
jgi:hypothetical protein